MLVPVILCGGSGTRLWPLSRSSYPKQFVDLGEGRTLFKETVRRSQMVASDCVPYVVTSDAHRFYAQANLYECNQQATIVVEPVARNTAPAIAAAAFVALAQDSDAILLVMPSDHAIEDMNSFKAAVKKGEGLAEEGYLVTFGIEPTAPETGFGYIRKGKGINKEGYVVDQFIEKPSEDLAKSFLESNEYYWNAGIFMFRADRYLEELNKYAANLEFLVQESVKGSTKIGNVIALNREAFERAEAISIDYAVMEQTENAALVPLRTTWTDLGSWEAFYNNKEKDENENVLEGDVIAVDTKRCYINSRNRLVATIGLDNLAVVETTDAILIAPLDRSQDVRLVVDQLKREKRPEATENRLVYRPWGSYEALAKGERFQVKRIIVRPGEELSLQKHYHRAEHWIVVAGSAEVILGNEKLFLTENQSTYIPVGEVHQLKNPGKIPLVVIEVQSGTYLGEDDIIRIEDKYHRNRHDGS